jgi:hypothetical protein
LAYTGEAMMVTLAVSVTFRFAIRHLFENVYEVIGEMQVGETYEDFYKVMVL